MEIFISLILLIITLMIGIPVPMAFFAVILFLIFVGGYDPSFLLPYGYNKMNNMVLLAMPLFIMAGGIIEKGKLGENLVNFIELFFGRIRGGLGIVAVVSCALFGAISGSSTATQTVIGSIMWPKMDAAGYSKGFSAALLASCALLGSYIPPSGIMIIYAWIAGQSVLACFLAVLGPGLILTVVFSTFSYIWCKKNEDKIIMPPKFEKQEGIKHAKMTVWRAIPALFFPVIVLGGIYGGFVTPTESAAISVVYAIPVAVLIYKGIKWKDLLRILVDTATTSGVVVVMLYCVMMLSRIYIIEDVPGLMNTVLTSISDNKYVIMLLINLLLIVIGMLMDDISAMMLTVPIFLPVLATIGVSPIHFAAFLAVNLGLACVTPPCAPLLFLASRLSNTPISQILKPTLIIIIFIWLPMLALVTYFPIVSMYLPHVLMGVPY